ncbi:hypothetical protein STRIP9103_05228 [Streptomyces ipomoeae 91-03]|uniref:Uncharacterized protein n=1 Tax=Streptomyces ipomoeae 91-03 TaxID=698759 RepID=L1KXU3_9ACTN|nr:hypothetical protein STRIP9103_05228 [Streptomyces ipomoeae 91-03]
MISVLVHRVTSCEPCGGPGLLMVVLSGPRVTVPPGALPDVSCGQPEPAFVEYYSSAVH